MGSIYARGNILWFRHKDHTGKWTQASSGFRVGVLADILERSPCILTEQHLGPIVDKDPEWRPTALFAREELMMLISDPLIPPDRHVVYALEGIGGLRHGEMAGLRWRHYDPT